MRKLSKIRSRALMSIIGLMTLAAILQSLSSIDALSVSTANAANSPSFLQTNFGRTGAGTTVSVPFPGANTAGNTIVAYVLWSETGTTSLSDTLGNTYASVAAPTRWSGNAASAQVFYATNVKGGVNSVTATFSTAIRTFGLLYIHEYSGIDTANPLDGASGAVGGSTTLNSGLITTTNPTDLLFSAAASSDTVNTAGSGYTVRSTGRGNMTADRYVSTAGQYNASGTQSGGAWVSQVVAFRAATLVVQSATNTPVPTQTQTRTATPAAMDTATTPPTPTVVLMNTATSVPVNTVTSTPTRTAVIAATSTPTQPINTVTATPTRTAINTATLTPVPTSTATGGPPATPVFLQGTFGRTGSGTTVSVPFSAANASGNTIVVYLLWSESGTASLADTQGNLYHWADVPTRWNGNTGSAQVFYATNVRGGANTVTATFSTAIQTFGLLYIHEYSGIDSANPMDGTSAGTGSGSALDSGFISTSNPTDLLFSAAASADTINSAGSGYTVRSTGRGNMTADKNVTTKGQYNASGTQGGGAWVSHVVALRAAGSTLPGNTATPTQTPVNTLSPTPTRTAVPGNTATLTQTPVAGATVTLTPTRTPVNTPTLTPTPTLTAIPTPTQPAGNPVLPIKASANHRYLVDQNNVPWLMAGDSPQSIIGNLTEADADLYFANRHADGFNSVWINLLCNSYTYCNSDGSTFDGIRPFTTPGDLSTPNPAYFTKVDHILQLAANHGIVVLLDPIETGGWLSVANANGTAKSNAYGQFLGNRYKNFPNIIWMSGNDFQSWRNAPDDAMMQTVNQGIKATDPNHMTTVELDYLSSGSAEDPTWAPLINLNAAYTYFPTFERVITEYNRGTMPVFMVEANYEGEHNYTDQGTPEILRRQEYWTLLSGASGQLYGNMYTVRFQAGWKTNLDTPGAIQFNYVSRLFTPRQWYNLVPDQTHTVVTAGYGTFNPSATLAASDYATVARTPDGSLVMAYVPTSRTITVDMTKLSATATARWYDPANGTYTAIAGSPIANTGSKQFTTPGTNAGGNGDWVLLLETNPAP